MWGCLKRYDGDGMKKSDKRSFNFLKDSWKIQKLFQESSKKQQFLHELFRENKFLARFLKDIFKNIELSWNLLQDILQDSCKKCWISSLGFTPGMVLDVILQILFFVPQGKNWAKNEWWMIWAGLLKSHVYKNDPLEKKTQVSFPTTTLIILNHIPNSMSSTAILQLLPNLICFRFFSENPRFCLKEFKNNSLILAIYIEFVTFSRSIKKCILNSKQNPFLVTKNLIFFQKHLWYVAILFPISSKLANSWFEKTSMSALSRSLVNARGEWIFSFRIWFSLEIIENLSKKFGTNVFFFRTKSSNKRFASFGTLCL